MNKILFMIIVLCLSLGMHAQNYDLYAGKPEVVLADSVYVRFVVDGEATITIDGRNLGIVSPEPYKVRNGKHEVIFEAKGKHTKTLNINTLTDSEDWYRVHLKDKFTPKKYEATKGLQQEVNLNWGFVAGYNFINSGFADYIIGYRLNNWLFLGGGVGLHLYDTYKFDIQQSGSSGVYREKNRRNRYVAINCNYPREPNIVSLDIPIYLHAKVYLTKTRVQPFLMTSAGFRLGLTQIADIGAYFQLGPGVSCRINDRHSAYLTFLYSMGGYNDFEGYSCPSSCQHKSVSHSHFGMENKIGPGFTLQLGLTF